MRTPTSSRLGAAAAAALLLLLAVPASASVAQSTVVLEDAVDVTPHLQADAEVPAPAVLGFEQQGTTMYVAGSFSRLQDARRTTSYRRAHLAAFDAETGAVSETFRPRVDGPVWAVRASGDSIWVAGEFSHVDGEARRGVARLDATTGRLVRGFSAPAVRGDASDLRIVRDRLIVGGTFGRALVALDLTTGRDTGYLDLDVQGTVSDAPGSKHVYRFAVDPAGTRLVAIGNFATVNGQERKRAFMVELGEDAGRLSPWYYAGFAKECRTAKKTPAYLRDVDFSPDGSYFAVVSTGGTSVRGERGETVCDAAARFETAVARPARPTWINYTGADTLHSVAVTGAAVYVSGHQRWLDNPLGHDTCERTCVERPGIGAIDPRSGRALPWNPTKSRNVGGRELYATPTGLWVGSDGKLFGDEFHYGIAYAPLPSPG